MKRKEFLAYMDLVREELTDNYDDYDHDHYGLCTCFKVAMRRFNFQAYKKDKYTEFRVIMHEYFRDGEDRSYYCDKNKEGYETRLLILCLLEEIMLDEKLYKGIKL